MQVRGPFLILALALSFLGISAAARDGSFPWIWGLLITVGVTLAHMSVNLFNEISDYKTGIDSNTNRTPFSGGSGLMQSGITNPGQVTFAAWLTLIIAGSIGAASVWRAGWPLLLFIIPGGIAIRFYTTHFARWGLGEFIAGLTLGSMVVAGAYFVIHKALPWHVILLSIPPGLLTFQLLYLNEFPDMEADLQGGRKHLVILLGRKSASRLYAALNFVIYALIAAAPFISTLPRTVWLGLLTLPMAFIASKTALSSYDDMERLVPAMGMNVGVVLLTDILLAVGLLIA